MFSSSGKKKYERAYMRKQQREALRHRKNMKLRELKEVHNGTSSYFRERKTFSQKVTMLFNYITKKSSQLFNAIRKNTKILFKFIQKKYKQIFMKTSSESKVSGIKNVTTRRRIILKPRTKKTKKESPVKNKRKKTWWHTLRTLLIIISIGFLFILGFFFFWFSTLEIPSVQNFENRKISNSTKIYDKTGEILLYDIHDEIRRTVVKFDDIAPSARDAIVAIEDHTFYEHHGIVIKSTLRAVFQTLLSKAGLSSDGTAGGSTLTQQVVKNTLLNRDKVLSRKVKEWVLAYKIDQKLSKNEILEIYLNEAPYGGTMYGIQEASRRFFGIPASELSIAQSAYLAAIPNLPTYYSPYGPNKAKLDARQQTVLREMKRYGFINDEEYRQASLKEVLFLPKSDNEAKSLHFVQYIRAELEEKYGKDVVQNGGLEVITTLDYELQQQAEEIIKEHIEEVEGLYDASNAALVAIDSKTGQIITMVGSRDYFDTENFDGNYNVTLALRQPGSAFKPIAYATAFERGYLPESSIFDTQTQFNAKCQPTDSSSNDGCYSPNNYDFKFKGPLTWRSALAESRNIPAIKVSYLAGISNVIQKARDMGISSLNKSPEHYGLGLVLGGGEVSLLELTGAYGVLSNDGVYNKTTGILEVRDIDGNILEKYISNEERVIDQNAVRMVNSVLSDNQARTPLFGVNSFLYFGGKDVAGKTGTTNDNRDAWLVGYTPQVAVGVWTGNNDNSPMKKGSSISGKPWRKYMDLVIKNYENESFGAYELPEDFDSLPNMIRGNWFGGTTIYVDTVSGKLATEFTPEETKIAVPQPDPHTILHWVNKNNPTVLDESHSDPQYKNWEYGVAQFAKENLSAILDIELDIPTEYDDVHTASGTQKTFDIEITGIESAVTYNDDEELLISFTTSDKSDEEIQSMQVFINNAFVTTDDAEPFEVSFIPKNLSYITEENILRMIVTDNKGQRSVKEVELLINQQE